MPGHDVHHAFIDWAEGRIEEPRARSLVRRMAERSGIDHRWSVLPPTADGGSPIAAGGFYHGHHWGHHWGHGYGWGPAIGVGFGGVYVDTGLNGCLRQRWVETRRGMRLRTANVCAY